MREYIDDVLHEIDSEINNSHFFDVDIISSSLTMIQYLQKRLGDLRKTIVCYQFKNKEEEIVFLKSKNLKY